MQGNNSIFGGGDGVEGGREGIIGSMEHGSGEVTGTSADQQYEEPWKTTPILAWGGGGSSRKVDEEYTNLLNSLGDKAANQLILAWKSATTPEQKQRVLDGAWARWEGRRQRKAKAAEAERAEQEDDESGVTKTKTGWSFGVSRRK